MSRSVHQTLKSVFGGKSRTEMDYMIENDDPDWLAWVEKHQIKVHVRNMRDLKKLADQIGEPLPESLEDPSED